MRFLELTDLDEVYGFTENYLFDLINQLEYM